VGWGGVGWGGVGWGGVGWGGVGWGGVGWGGVAQCGTVWHIVTPLQAFNNMGTAYMSLGKVGTLPPGSLQQPALYGSTY
jgi:hypothetical protein